MLLEAKNMFSVESLDDEVFTFKLSDMIIILKKKYLYVFVVVLFGVLCAMYYYSNSAVDPRLILRPSNYFFFIDKMRRKSFLAGRSFWKSVAAKIC